MKRVINEKVATCYYKSTRTIVRNGHLIKMTKEIELAFVESKEKSTYYSRKNKKKKLFKY
nr:MAG TPA: hypothetical protein [Crassvirales sp.]